MNRTPHIDRYKVRRNFSAHAQEYEEHARVQRFVVDLLTALVAERQLLSGPLLEVGTGTGRLRAALTSQQPDLPLVVTDLAHGMTRVAADRLPAALAVDADAQALPFQRDFFGLVCSSSVYQWVPDLSGAFRENFRVLRSGGWFVFALFGERTLWELRQSHRQAAADCGRGQSHVHDFPDEAEVTQALAAAGFAEILVLSKDEIEYYEDVAGLLRGLKGIGAANASTARAAGIGGRRVMQRMIALYRELAGENMLPATYQVIYGVAQRPF